MTLGLFLLLSIMVSAGALDAAEVPKIAEAQRPAAMDREMLRLAIPLTLTAGVLFFYLLVYYKRRRRNSRTPDSRVDLSLGAESPLNLGEPVLRDSQPQLAAAGSLGELELIEPSGPPPPPQVLSDAKRAECPVCRREFDSMLAMCPFDSEKLVPKPPATAKPVGTDTLDVSISYRHCPQCDLSFDVGNDFCPYDRTPLEAENRALDGDDELALECPVCGLGFEGDAVFCDDDGARLVSSSDGETPQTSASPVLICASCALEHSVSSTCCEDCGGPLVVLHGRLSSGTSLKGRNTTMVCPECGERYAEGMVFCAKDGAELVGLN